MGNASQKLAEKCAILSRDEIPIVAGSFRLVSRNSERIKEDDLMKYWGSQMDPRMAQYVINFLFGPTAERAHIVEFQRFAELFVYSTRGTIDERIGILLNSLGQTDLENAEIAYPVIKEFIEAVVSSYMRAIKTDGNAEFKSWESRGFRIVKECVQKLAESLASEVVQQESQKVTRADAERWLQQSPTFVTMLEYVFAHLYRFRPVKHVHHDEYGNSTSKQKVIVPQRNKLLPFCEGIHYMPDYPAFTDVSQMLFINSNVPSDLRNRWRFLFSSQVHGESFSTLMGRIVNQGPNIIIIEDTTGSVFGGYASQSWTYGPKFYGNDQSFLFSLRPKMRFYTTTGYNDHYQYLNLNQQTMPNGLGMGGQFSYWGLWLDQEYGRGECSESCTTFKNYVQLSANKQFQIRNIEVWGVGPKPRPPNDDEEPRDSILEGHLEDKAVMEMAGRGRYSEGFRDNKPTDIEFQN